MDPILFTLKLGAIERPIGTFGLMLVVAILLGATFAVRGGLRLGIHPGISLASCGFVAAGGLLGGSGLFVIVELIRVGHVEGLGLVFYGSLVGGGLGLLLSQRVLQLPALRWLDDNVAAIPLAHAIGRLGCFLGGCCYGAPSDLPWAVRYTHPLAPAAHPSVLRHPSPLYESAALLLLAWGLCWWRPKKAGVGQRIGLYLVGYALIRSLVEFTRGDLVRGIAGHVSTSQWISIAAFAIGLFLLFRTPKQSSFIDES